MERSPENKKALEVQKVFVTSSGQVLYKMLEKFTTYNGPPPRDVQGRMDALAVLYNEGRRSVMMYVNDLINKNVNEIKQAKAEVK